MADLTPAVSDAQPPRRPTIARAEYTFDVKGSCVYCGEPCQRIRTFSATTLDEAEAKAAVALDTLCHRKCGGY